MNDVHDDGGEGEAEVIHVRRMDEADIDRVWEFLKRVFREVNRQTVEYQRPRSKPRFVESYDDDGVDQLIFEVDGELIGYAECAFDVTGSDNWVNPRYFESRDMRPMFVEELAAHPAYQGRGVGSFMLEQLEHLARLHGCTHLVLEVAENNQRALSFYRKRDFFKLDASLFLARELERDPELLPPRPLKPAPASTRPPRRAARGAPTKGNAAKGAASRGSAAKGSAGKGAAAKGSAGKPGASKATIVKALSERPRGRGARGEPEPE